MNERNLEGLLTDSKEDDEFLILPELLPKSSILPMEELPDGVESRYRFRRRVSLIRNERATMVSISAWVNLGSSETRQSGNMVCWYPISSSTSFSTNSLLI